jgi:DNA-binding CsgD family transcriptional regulator
MALLMEAVAHAHMGDRAAVDAAVAQAAELAPGDLDVQGGCWGAARAMLSLLDEDRGRALQELDRGMDYLRRSPTTNSYPFRGLWALLRTVDDEGGEAARAEVAASGVTVMRRNRAYLWFAEAVALGRAGRREQAEQRFADADAEARMLVRADWFRRHAHRLVAEAAIADGWGDPVAWLRGALPAFRDSGHRRIAVACQQLLRRAGAPVPRRGRGSGDVPGELRSAGVTSREVDVLELVVAGLSNREIAASLYLSPRTVEKHVASLLAKTGAATRSQLALPPAQRRAGR